MLHPQYKTQLVIPTSKVSQYNTCHITDTNTSLSTAKDSKFSANVSVILVFILHVY